MEILGVGPLELIFILVIALIVIGPNDMAKTGRTLGRFLRSVVTSPTWASVREVTNQVRVLPNKLMREAGLEEADRKMLDPRNLSQQAGIDDLRKEIKNVSQQADTDLSPWMTPPAEVPSDPQPPDPSIQPPKP